MLPGSFSHKQIAWLTVASWGLLLIALVKRAWFFKSWELSGWLSSRELDAQVLVAVLGFASCLFAARAIPPKRKVLCAAAVVYLLLYISYHAWGTWLISSAAATQGFFETLAVTLRTHGRGIIAYSGLDESMVVAMAYSLAIMPVIQLIVAVHLARDLALRTSNN